jgi:hypothetical protein
MRILVYGYGCQPMAVDKMAAVAQPPSDWAPGAVDGRGSAGERLGLPPAADAAWWAPGGACCAAQRRQAAQRQDRTVPRGHGRSCSTRWGHTHVWYVPTRHGDAA